MSAHDIIRRGPLHTRREFFHNSLIISDSFCIFLPLLLIDGDKIACFFCFVQLNKKYTNPTNGSFLAVQEGFLGVRFVSIKCSETTGRESVMSIYQAKIRKTADETFFTYIVRIDNDGEESVVGDYKSRHFDTEKAALKSTATYLKKIGANDCI